MTTDDGTQGMVTRRLLLSAATTFVIMIALSMWAYTRLPADALVPLHWDASGAVDDYASKGVGLFALVAAFPLLVGVLLVVPKIEPRRRNLMRSATAYRATMYAVMGFFAALHAVIVASALGYQVDVNRLLMFAVGVLMVIIGNWLPKTRSTFMFGLRTPWTLASDHTWRRSHRAAGWAFIGLGLATIVLAALMPTRNLLGFVGGGIALVVIGLFVYSYVVWRNAPDRRPRGGTA